MTTLDAADREAFLSAVRADQADNLPKQIYADYLGERGDTAELAWRAPWRRLFSAVDANARLWHVAASGLNATKDRYARFDVIWPRLKPWHDRVRRSEWDGGGRATVRNATDFVWFPPRTVTLLWLRFSATGHLSGIAECEMVFQQHPAGRSQAGIVDTGIDRRGFTGLLADVMSVVLDLPPPRLGGN